jgi:pilus assembly protein CpaE
VQKRLLARAAEIVVVTTPMLAALRNTRTLMVEMKAIKSNLKDVDLVVNMSGMASSEEVPAQDIKAALNMPPLAVIPYASKIFAASEATGKALGKNKEAAKITELLMPLAEKASATGYKGSRVADNKFDLMKTIRTALGK